jgi:hypothetical protein
MPRYMITRTLPPLTPNDWEAVRQKSAEVCREMGINWIRSHVTADGKMTYCEYEAADEEAVREHARRAGIPVDDIIMLSMELGPSMRLTSV